MVTGSKGGGGKTPVASSIAIALSQLDIPVLACDFNFNNHDLLTIFHGMNITERKKKNWMQEYIFGNNSFWRISKNFWLTRWQSIMNLGLPSTTDMWKKIDLLAKTDFPPGSEPKIMVFDTNLTLPLICPPHSQIQDFPDLPQVEVWHLWSPSIVLQINEQDRFVKAIDLLNRFSSGFEERLTHIFTPRHFQSTSFFGTFSSIAKGEFSISKKPKYKQANAKPILFPEIKDAVFANFLPEILNFNTSDKLEINELLEKWFNNLIEMLKKREFKTNNVIIVPTVVHKIALLVEQLTLKPRRTIDTAIEDLGSLYEIIQEHFTKYRESFIQELTD